MLYSSILALAIVASAAPSPAPAAGFSAPAIFNRNLQRNGTAELLRAYAKYHLTPTKAMPSGFLAALQKRDTSVAAFTQNSIQYLISASIGGQILNLEPQTATGDLWVFSTELPSENQVGHNVYDPSQSSTYTELDGYDWDYVMEDGSRASGIVGTDTVNIGGIIVEKQAIQLADYITEDLVGEPMDGALGLGFSSINTVKPNKQRTFLDRAEKSLSTQLFTAYLPFKRNGSYDFGYIDNKKHRGEIKYANINSKNGFWEFESKSYKVGDKEFRNKKDTTASADTATTLMLMDVEAVETYYKAVDSAYYSDEKGGYMFPCDTEIPPFSFRIGHHWATIPSDMMVVTMEDMDREHCFGALQSGAEGQHNVYGSPFFNTYFLVFDRQHKRLGFAPIAVEEQEGEGSSA